MDRRRPFWTELLVPLAVAGFGVAFYVDTRELSRQAVFFPHTMMVIMSGLTALVLVEAWRSRRRQAAPSRPGFGEYRNPALVVGGAAIYLGLIALLGYFPATATFLVASLLVFDVRPRLALAVGVALPVALYVVFAVAFGVRV